jgi:hypothetical protein
MKYTLKIVGSLIIAFTVYKLHGIYASNSDANDFYKLLYYLLLIGGISLVLIRAKDKRRKY